MKWRPYPKYKNSGVKWLGDVPEGWEVKALKYLASLKSGEQISYENITDDEPYPVYGGNGFRGYTDRFTHEGNYILIGRQGALCGNINYASGKFWASEHAVIVIVKNSINVVWLGEVLRSMNLNQYSVTAAQPGLNVQKIVQLLLPLPPIKEQQAIAAFLNKETDRIDALIAKKKALIEKLKEQRTAIISNAVTKGLPADVAPRYGLAPHTCFKPSGVDWLGDIPERWTLKRLKQILKETRGAMKTGPFGSQLQSKDMEGEDIKVFNQRNVIDNDFISGDNYISQEKFFELKSFEVFAGDILITTRGTIGRCAVVPDIKDRAILHPCLIRMQADEEKIVVPYFVYLIEGSYIFIEQLKIKSNANTIDVVYSENLREVVLPIPPVPEQKTIAAYLDEQTGKIDALIAKLEQAITTLQEYRTALITAAVTGKIDVRHEGDMQEIS